MTNLAPFNLNDKIIYMIYFTCKSTINCINWMLFFVSEVIHKKKLPNKTKSVTLGY